MENETKIGNWKELMVTELTDRFKGSDNFYLSSYIGLKSEDMNELRRTLEAHSSTYIVLKNSIAKIALKNAGLNELSGLITGCIGVTLTGDDPVGIAKILAKFSKTHEPLKLKGGYLEGSIIDEAKLRYIASLPGREELIAKIVYMMKFPISGFVGVLGNTLKGFLYVLQAIKDKKGG